MTLTIGWPAGLARLATTWSKLQAWGVAVRRQRIATQALRERCEAALRDLYIPVPFDSYTFCTALATRRGRPIVLLPLSLRGMTGQEALYGLLMSKPSCDIIVYEKDTSWAHQQQIIMHEASHLIFDHPSEPLTCAEMPPLPQAILEDAEVRHLHRRSGIWTVQEVEAEVLASLVLKRAAGLQTPDQIQEPDLTAALTRLEPFYGRGDNA